MPANNIRRGGGAVDFVDLGTAPPEATVLTTGKTNKLTLSGSQIITLPAAASLSDGDTVPIVVDGTGTLTLAPQGDTAILPGGERVGAPGAKSLRYVAASDTFEDVGSTPWTTVTPDMLISKVRDVRSLEATAPYTGPNGGLAVGLRNQSGLVATNAEFALTWDVDLSSLGLILDGETEGGIEFAMRPRTVPARYAMGFGTQPSLFCGGCGAGVLRHSDGNWRSCAWQVNSLGFTGFPTPRGDLANASTYLQGYTRWPYGLGAGVTTTWTVVTWRDVTAGFEGQGTSSANAIGANYGTPMFTITWHDQLSTDPGAAEEVEVELYVRPLAFNTNPPS